MADSWWDNFVGYVAGVGGQGAQQTAQPPRPPRPPIRYASAPAPIQAERAKIESSIAKRQAARPQPSKAGDPGYVPTLEEHQANEAKKRSIAAESIRRVQGGLPGEPVDDSKNPKVEWLKDNILPGQLPGDKAHVAGGGTGGRGMDIVQTGGQQPEIANED